MKIAQHDLESFGPASHCASLKDALHLIRENPGSSEIRSKAAACGMALHAMQAVRETTLFEDSRFVVDELSRAKSALDISGFHDGDVTSTTSAILAAAQRCLDENTIGCHEWPSPEEIAGIALHAALIQTISNS